MNNFILIVITLSTIAECCLCFGGHHWEKNEDFIKIKDKICDEKVRPDANQWAAYFECNPHNEYNRTDNSSNLMHEKWAEKV